MAIDTTPIWLMVSSGYIFAGIYYHLRYKDWIPKAIPAALLTFGMGLFLAVNRRNVFGDPIDPVWIEITVLLLIGSGLLFAILSVRSYTELRKKYGEPVSDRFKRRRD